MSVHTRCSPCSARAAWARSTARATSASRATSRSRSSTPTSPRTSSGSRFEHEAKAAGALNHPNIVAVYDTGQSDGSPYIVSELLQGETLRDRLATGALGVRKAVDYGVQIARGLAAAHEKGIVHRDLKPENLFLTKDGLVKILDFGIAKLGRPGEEESRHRSRDALPPAPARARCWARSATCRRSRCGGCPTDHRSDLFSFGAVLFEMLTGERAFKGTTAADTLSAILREDPTEALGRRAGHSAGPAARRAALPREGARGPLPDRARPRVRARGRDDGVGASVAAATPSAEKARRSLASGLVASLGLLAVRRGLGSGWLAGRPPPGAALVPDG